MLKKQNVPGVDLVQICVNVSEMNELSARSWQCVRNSQIFLVCEKKPDFGSTSTPGGLVDSINMSGLHTPNSFTPDGGIREVLSGPHSGVLRVQICTT